MKNQKHVILINVDFNKKFFTNHGLHKNSQGKEKIARLIAYNCRNFFVRKLRFLILLIGDIIKYLDNAISNFVTYGSTVNGYTGVMNQNSLLVI